MYAANIKDDLQTTSLKCHVSWDTHIVFFFYIIKQDIRIYVPYSRPNSCTEWAEFLCGHSGVFGGCFRLKNRFFSKKIFSKLFFNIFFPRATPGPLASSK